VKEAGESCFIQYRNTGAVKTGILMRSSFTKIDFPGSSTTQATGISDNGQIEGVDEGALGGAYGFLDDKWNFQFD
jgi:hypothetical protein